MLNALFSVISALLFLSANVVPTKSAELVAFAPYITYPTQDTVWTSGAQGHVSWDTDNIPDEALGYTVTVLLGHLTDNSENLDTTHPLATYVPITDGIATVTVPSVPYRADYIVVVIGDSGDRSPPFTIRPPTSSAELL